MPHTKGATLVLIRQLLQERGPDFENHVLSQITDIEREIYYKANVLTWTPAVFEGVPDEKTLITAASNALFPDDPAPLRTFGKRAANYAINGLYKVLFRIPSVYTIAKRAAMVWRTYNDTGALYVEGFTKEGNHISFQFVLKHYPTLPENVREMLAGYYNAVLEWTGAKQVTITRNKTYSEPSGWIWVVHADY